MERLADNVDFLGQLEYVNIAARRLFGGQLLGFRRSRRFGTGLEYADFRAYTLTPLSRTALAAERRGREP